MKHRILALTFVILFLNYFVFANCEENYDFRKTRWGMSRNQVVASEGTAPSLQNESQLVWDSKFLGKNVAFVYFFRQDKLVGAFWSLEETHADSNDYIKDYQDLKKALMEKYGRPKLDKINWMNNRYQDDSAKWGLALELGHIECISSWETDSTSVFLSLQRVQGRIICLARFDDKKYVSLKKELGNATSPISRQKPAQIHGITIKGIIVNLGDIKEFVHNDTYLQIVQVSSTGETTLLADEKSGFTFKSQLAKIPFPSDGVFEFTKISLEEGKYMIAAQPLKIKTIPLSRINQPPLNTSIISSGKGRDGWPIPIIIKKDANPEQLVFDLKKVWLPPPL